MKVVRLYGEAGRRFGRVWRFDVASPAEAVRALCSQVPGFRGWLQAQKATPFRVLADAEARDAEGLALPTAARTIRLVPVVGGAGKGVGRVILGVVLIWMSGGFASMGYAGMGAGFGAGATAGWAAVGAVGVSLVMGGVSQMLTKTPRGAESADRPDNRAGTAFDGAVNTAAQGNPVPVCYGELIVGSQVVSAGLSTEGVAP